MESVSCRNTFVRKGTYNFVQNNARQPAFRTLTARSRLNVCVFVVPPPDAVTVRVEVFTAAVDVAFKVKVLLPFPGDAMLVGTKFAVIPAGSPLTESAIADLNPFTAAPVTITGVDPLRATTTLAPPNVSVKVGPITVRPNVCVFVTPPPVAVTTGEYVLPRVVAAAVRVSVLPPLPGIARLAGENFAVTPPGSPLTENVIADLNSFAPVVFSPNVVELPAVTVALVDDAVNVNVGTITVRLIVCVLLTPVPVPFIVTVETLPTALAPAVSVMALAPVPGEAMLAGANVAVTPAGSPLADNAIAERYPLIVAVETVIVTGVPAATVALAALGVTVKLGAITVTAMV